MDTVSASGEAGSARSELSTPPVRWWGRLRGLGPGLLVTAAFIGPGTVTTASKAGAGYGVVLLWAVLFATLATIVLQEMAARLGLASRRSLGQVIREGIPVPALRFMACGLVMAAIFFGNAAYQTGNLMGTAIGLELLTGIAPGVWVVATGLLAGLLLMSGAYQLIERVLIGLVIVMSLLFLSTALLVRPDMEALLSGLFVPRIPSGSLPVVLGLIGTTVVPYNLFLHASAVQQRWPASQDLRSSLAEARLDTGLSILLGGGITMAIVITGAAVQSSKGISSAADMARQLSPLLGDRLGEILFSTGLFSAGLTSAITAPLAAAYATSGVLGWPSDLRSARFRAVWLVVLVAGMAMALLSGRSPTETILISQVANGLLLPIIALILLIAVNRPSVMSDQTNGPLSNLAGLATVIVCTVLGLYLVLTKLGVLG